MELQLIKYCVPKYMMCNFASLPIGGMKGQRDDNNMRDPNPQQCTCYPNATKSKSPFTNRNEQTEKHHAIRTQTAVGRMEMANTRIMD